MKFWFKIVNALRICEYAMLNEVLSELVLPIHVLVHYFIFIPPIPGIDSFL